MEDKDKRKQISIYDNVWGKKIPLMGFYVIIFITILIVIAYFMGWFSENDPIEPIIK